jgi:hypothetical protein
MVAVEAPEYHPNIRRMGPEYRKEKARRVCCETVRAEWRWRGSLRLGVRGRAGRCKRLRRSRNPRRPPAVAVQVGRAAKGHGRLLAEQGVVRLGEDGEVRVVDDVVAVEVADAGDGEEGGVGGVVVRDESVERAVEDLRAAREVEERVVRAAAGERAGGDGVGSVGGVEAD